MTDARTPDELARDTVLCGLCEACGTPRAVRVTDVPARAGASDEAVLARLRDALEVAARREVATQRRIDSWRRQLNLEPGVTATLWCPGCGYDPDSEPPGLAETLLTLQEITVLARGLAALADPDARPNDADEASAVVWRTPGSTPTMQSLATHLAELSYQFDRG